ncbi:MAG: thioredoxin domain-containing protein [Candidatus Binatia bacterium]
MPSSSRHRVALLIALAGAAVAAYTQHVGTQLESGSGYTSFCNLGGIINCDAVIGSRYSRLLGVSDAWAGIAAFLAGAALALPGALGARAAVADLLLVGLAAGSMGFTLVLAGVMAFALRKLCILCLTLDVLTLAWFVTVVPLTGRFEGGLRALARLAVAGGLVATLGAGAFAALRTPGSATNVDEVRARDPKFFDLYMKLPVRAVQDVEGSGRHVKGQPSAPVTLVEFSDFQCPACGEAFADLKKLAARPDVRMIFRSFPLDASCNAALQRSFHPDACLAAMAAECAGDQSRFWEYHDQLFQNQKTLDRESLFRYARAVGLDIPAFRTCLDAPETRARVVTDVEAGLKLGISSTPTLFFNGRLVDGALEDPYYDYALIIEKHEREARPSRDGG